jgi:hypothetical protein
VVKEEERRVEGARYRKWGAGRVDEAAAVE